MKSVKVIVILAFFSSLIIFLLILSSSNNIAQSEYFPLVSGRVLIYTMYSTKNSQWSGNKVLTFTGPDADNVYTVRDETTGHASIMEKSYYKKTKLGYMYNVEDGSNLKYLYLPTKLNIGTVWRLNSDPRIPTRKVTAANEKVVTPAGSFNCMKVKINIEGTWELWYSKGVGLVKEVTPNTITILTKINRKNFFDKLID